MIMRPLLIILIFLTENMPDSFIVGLLLARQFQWFFRPFDCSKECLVPESNPLTLKRSLLFVLEENV